MIATDMSADTRRIADTLSEVPRGETIAWDQLSGIISRDILLSRHILYSAMRVAERESGAIFASERGKGYRRLAPDEIVKIGQTARRRIRSMARHGARTINAGTAGANDLSAEMTRAILSEQSALGLLEHLARDKSLPVVPEGDTRPLPVAQAAQEFLRIIGAKR